MPTYATLIIDVQVGLITGAYREHETLHNINQVIAQSRSNNATVIFIQHCHSSYKPIMRNATGWHIHEALNREKRDRIIEKEASDAFYETNLEEELGTLNVDSLVITGLQTQYCVDATCRSALSRNFNVLLVRDAHTTGNTNLNAEQIIDHHNDTLTTLAHPKHTIKLVSAKNVFA